MVEAEQAMRELDPRLYRLWERVRITPAQWKQSQYPDAGPFWVIAIIGRRCLSYNHVEAGWGWARFDRWGKFSEYHWGSENLQVPVCQLLFAIDEGGTG